MMERITTTKCEQLTDYLRRSLGSDYRDGDKLPPEAQWAKQLNVNKSTLSKALLQIQREGYLTRKTGVGTIVTRSRGDSLRIIMTAVLFPDLLSTRDTYYSTLFREIARCTLAHDRMHTAVSIGDRQRLMIDRGRLEHILRQSPIAGLIVAGARLADRETIEHFSRQDKVRIVWLGVRLKHPRVNCIWTDNHKSTGQLLAAAKAAGYNRLAFVSKALSTACRQERHKAFLDHVESADVYIGDETQNAFDAGYSAMRRILAAGTPPECILAADALTAAGIRKAEEDAHAPSHIPLLTYDRHEIGGGILAAAVQPIEQMAETAVDFIVDTKRPAPLQLEMNATIISAGGPVTAD